jgi:hypothetical protein
MRQQLLLTVALLIIVTVLHAGCSGGSAGGAESTWPACAADKFRLQGTLDGQSISSVESSAGGGFTQLATGEFSTQASNLALSPERTKLDLAWSHTVDDGGTTSASGTLTMPNHGPLAGQSFCLGNGTQIHFSSDGETFQFTLAGIAGGANCGSATVGTLQGCWR